MLQRQVVLGDLYPPQIINKRASQPARENVRSRWGETLFAVTLEHVASGVIRQGVLSGVRVFLTEDPYLAESSR